MPGTTARRRVVQDPDVANRALSYRAGWLHGAASRRMDSRFTAHDNAGIREEYQRGYDDGCVARQQAIAEAYERLGYVPSVMRSAGDREEVSGG